MTEEVRFFRRVSIYAFVVGAIYWFVSYEPAGTVLLLLFGVATGAGTLLLWWGARRRGEAAAQGPEPAASGRSGEPDGPFGDETGRTPAPTSSPFLVGLAVALIALGLVFGGWFVLAGLIPLALGAGSWLSAVRGELAGVEADDEPPEAGPVTSAPATGARAKSAPATPGGAARRSRPDEAL